MGLRCYFWLILVPVNVSPESWIQGPYQSWYQENCPPEHYPPENLPLWRNPYEYSHLWKLPPVKITPPQKIAPCENSSARKITPNEIPSPLINHTNERKNKIINFFALKKAVQYNILIKITKALFNTQMISQKILALNTFFTEWKKSKNRTKAKIVKWHLLASCTSQGELKLGSQIIKFGKMWKY